MEDIHNIKPLMEIDFPWVSLISLLGLLLGVFLIFVWLIQRWLAKRALKENIKPAVPKISPQELALKALSDLKNSGLIEKGHSQEFYLKLEAIFKRFLAESFQEPIYSYTRQELLRFMRSKNQAFPQFAPLLERGIFAKFAQSQIQSAEMDQDLNHIQDFIQKYPQSSALAYTP